MLHPKARRFHKPRRADYNPYEREDARTAVGPWNSILERWDPFCITHSDVSHREHRMAYQALPASVTLLASGSTLAMRCMSCVLRVGLSVNKLALGSLFGFGFCGGVLLVGGIAHGRGSVGFIGAL